MTCWFCARRSAWRVRQIVEVQGHAFPAAPSVHQTEVIERSDCSSVRWCQNISPSSVTVILPRPSFSFGR